MKRVAVAAMLGVLAVIGGGMRPRAAAADAGYPGFSGADLRSIAIDPTDPSSLLVWGPDSQWLSADAGASWTSTWTGATPVGFDPTDPSFVYATVNGNITRCTPDHTSCSVVDSPSPAQQLFVTPSGRIWAAESSDLVYSDDQGATWTSDTNGLPDTLTGYQVATLQGAPSGDGVAYLALNPPSQGVPPSFYRLNPQTGVWVQMSEPDLYGIGGVRISPADSDVLFAATAVALYRSDDGGASWTTLMGALHDPVQPSAFTIAPSDPQTLYLALDGGVSKSTDGAQTWSAASTVFQGDMVYDLAVDPQDPSTVYAATAAGAFVSTDGAQTWAPANTGISSDGFVLATASDPADPNIVYAGTQGGFWRSSDGGATWQYSESGLAANSTRVNSITVDPTDPSTVYIHSFWTGYFVSHDAGLTWAALSAPIGDSDAPVVVDPTNSQHLVIAGGYGMEDSTDGGQTFTDHVICCNTSSDNGLQNFTRVALDPTDPSTVYAGGRDGVWRSLDGGLHWARILYTGDPAGNSGDAQIMAVDPEQPNTIYYARKWQDLWISNDGGETWRDIPAQSLSLVLDSSTTPTTAYLTQSMGGLDTLRSTDQGMTWIPDNPDEAPPPDDTTSTSLAPETDVSGVDAPVRQLYDGASTVSLTTFVASTPTTLFRMQNVPHRPMQMTVNSLTVRLTCGDTWHGACRGTLALRRKSKTLARSPFDIAEGATGLVTVQLGAWRWKRLNHRGTLRVNALVTTTADRSLITDRRTLTLLAPRRH